MRSEHRSNALLVELLIVILFFMLAAGVLVQVFGKARNMSTRSETVAAALSDAQNVADQLYAAPDAEAALTALGFAGGNGVWTRSGAYDLTVALQEEAGPAGVMRRGEVRAVSGGETLLTLPVARWEEAQAE